MKVLFENGYAQDFVMCVPECFKDTLFRGEFDKGDTFYDCKQAYQMPWGDALKHIKYFVRVIDSGAAYVTYDVLTPTNDLQSAKKDGTHTVSNLEFIGLLKNGFR